jgi:probable DNA repair protein
VREAWETLLDHWSELAVVQTLLDAPAALASLRALAGETLFQPESPEVPIQVLGTLEAVGTQFDALWLTGLSADVWPAVPRPNPFLPLAWQRAQGVPRATAERERTYAQTLLDGFCCAADEIVFSYPQRDERGELRPSPLLPPASSAAPPWLPDHEAYAAIMQHSARLEDWHDERGVALAIPATVPGGVGVFESQAACPFRAYARHRLDSTAWPKLVDGLTPIDRGMLLHAALAHFWRSTQSHSALLDLQRSDTLAAAIDEAVGRALREARAPRWHALPEFAREVERARLPRLIEQWLALECVRAPFEVVGVEEKHETRVGDLGVALRIDRYDRLGDGSLVLIDYKTGRPEGGVRVLLGERPDAPQLPLYAHALRALGVPDAVALAHVRAGEVKAVGIAREASVWPCLTLADNLADAGVASWASLLEAWEAQLGVLAHEFVSGEARVAPKRYPKTCERCDQQAFCRIAELADGISRSENDDDGENGDA